jgi:hypothetical protein
MTVHRFDGRQVFVNAHPIGLLLGNNAALWLQQGDQIWPIFVFWATINFVRFYLNYKESPNFWPTFSTKMGWATFWAFLPTYLVTLGLNDCEIGVPQVFAPGWKVHTWFCSFVPGYQIMYQ